MALRVIEIVTPRSDKEDVIQSLEEHRSDEGYVFWATPMEDEDALSFRMILDVHETENVLDRLANLFAWTDKYRIVVYPAEATLPRLNRLEKDEEEEGKNGDAVGDKDDVVVQERISREELYDDVLDTSLLTKNYLMLVGLSSLVAIIGLLRDNVAVIIGAMVLAPLLGPNVGLSLATTLGDKKLSLQALKTLAAGVGLCLLLSVGSGMLLGDSVVTSELEARSVITFSDVILAIVSGTAGIITVTQGVPTSLVGVMVALSLLPPLAACGLFLGAGRVVMAEGAGLLFLANVICLNLAGVATFLLRGIRPLSWWEQEKAKSATIRAVLVWTALLMVLIAIMLFEGR